MKRQDLIQLATIHYWRVVRQCGLLADFMKRREPIQLVTILDYWRVIRQYQYRWMIVSMCLVSVVAAGVVSKFFIPAAYEAKAVILPAREERLAGMSFGGGDREKGGGSGSGGMVLDLLGGKGGATLTETLLTLLDSRTIAEAIAEDLNLMAYYGTNSLAGTANALHSQAEFRTTKYKAIEIIVLTKDPEMAARIANAYAVHLDRLNKRFSLQATRRTREFIELRVAEKSKWLVAAEEALKDFQTKNRSLGLKEQAEAAFGTVAELHGQIIALEVELAALREYATPSHPMINQLEVQIKELRRTLDRLESDPTRTLRSNKGSRPPMSKQAFPLFDEAPSLTLQYLRLARQLKIEEAVYSMLIGMLEQAKISETRDLPTVELLDPAIPSSFRSTPKTLRNMMAAGVLSLALGTLLAYFLNYLSLVQAQQAMSLTRTQLDHDRQVGEPEAIGNGDTVQGYPAAPQEAERVH